MMSRGIDCSELLRGLKDLVVIFDSEGKILFVNDTVGDYGVTRDEVIGNNIMNYVSREFWDKVREDLKSLGKERYVEGEVKMLTPEGERWVEYRTTLWKEENRKINYLSILRDIHDKKTRQEELHRLYEFTKKISSTLELEELFEVSYHELSKFLSFDAYTVGLVDKEKNLVKIEFSVEGGNRLPKRSYKISPEKSLSSWVVYHGKPLLIGNLDEEEERLPAKVHKIGRTTKSWLGVPLIFRNEVIGLINIQSFQPYLYGEDELKLLENFSNQLSMAIGNALLYRNVKLKEKEERKEREKYRRILDNLLTGIVIIHEGKIVYANEAMEKLLGYYIGESLGEEFLKFVHPEMREYVKDNYIRRVMGLPAPESYIIELIDSKGRSRWVQLRATLVEWEGVSADLVSLQDITPMKDMEKKLMSLVKVFRDLKLARTKEEVYAMTMDALFKILNFSYAALSEVQGDRIILVDYRGYDPKRIREVKLKSEKSVVAWVARNRKPYYVPDVKKDPLYVRGGKGTGCEYATPIIVGNKVFGVIDVERDEVDSITEEERNLLDMLGEHVAVTLAGLQRQEALQKAKNFQELMVHIMSHDLKNPLSVARGYLDMLEEEYNEEYLSGISRALEHSFTLIEKVRLFSKLGMGRIKENKTEINLRESLERLASIIKKKYKDARITMNIGEAKLYAYPLLEEVFMNLLDNAFKYGAEEVRVSVEESDGSLLIKVADNGPGIPDDMKQRIFEPFERLSSKKGSGLGLAIVKMIVELHDGKIWIENNEPQGSIFVIQLPNGRSKDI